MRAHGLTRLAAAIVVLCAGTGASPASAASTLYDDLGGHDGLARIVHYSMAAYVADPRIKDQFDNINLGRLDERIFLQFCELTGGPCKYPGRDMAAAHKGLHLDTAQFDALVEDLQSTMDQLGVAFRTQNRLLALLAPMKRQIVTR